MFTDMVAYSALVQADEAGALALLEEHNRRLRPIFSRFGGRVVKTVGDAFLVEFESALDATQCAFAVQQDLHHYNATAPEPKQIQIRIGVHVGDVVPSENDVLGDAVNIASRIEPLAEPGGISLSQQVYDQVQNKLDVAMLRLPPVSLKNIRSPLTVYRVVLPWQGSGVRAEPAGTTPSHSLAVLPLSNISPDPNDAYFADGLTEELISVLSQLPGLSVIARTSVAQYKSSPKPVAQVGAELGVDSVLEGSVRKAGNRIRVTLQLIDVGTQRHIWAGSYNREIDDVFAVQADVADRTAETLRLTLAKRDAGEEARKPTENREAYELYLRGLVTAGLPAPHGLQLATRYYERATELDPEFTDAYAAWADLLVTVSGDYLSVREVMPKARALAARALELDPDSSLAHAALGNIAMQFDHDWPRAETEFRTAIRLNPNNARARRFYGLLLIALERFEEAKEEYRNAIRVDPDGQHQRNLSWAELESGNFDGAIESAREEVARRPSDVNAHVYLGFFYFYAGRRAEARKEAEFPATNAGPVERYDHALLNAMVGRPDEARQILAATDRGEGDIYTSFSDRAMLRAALGENAVALDLLEKDAREGDGVFWLYYRGAFFDAIRDDPRFVALLQQFRLPTRGVHRGPSERP
jgi:adenylate cyclase